jgi:hypothetical protein
VYDTRLPRHSPKFSARKCLAVLGTSDDSRGEFNHASCAGAGAVAQAFRCALQSRLAEQLQLFALLEKQLQHPLPTASVNNACTHTSHQSSQEKVH